MKRIKHFLLMNDWLWSPFMAFLAYWFCMYGPPTIGDVAVTYYAINWIQPLIATGGIMAGLFSIARLGMWFNLRVLHRYIWPKFKEKREPVSKYTRDETVPQEDKYPGFNSLEVWQKILFSFFWLALLLVIATVVFLRLLSAQGAPIP